MIDLVCCLKELDDLLPLIPEVIGMAPQLQAAGHLAAAIGANPASLTEAENALFAAHSLISQAVAEATPFISAATHDLLNLGQDFLLQAGRILPRLLSPVLGDAQIALAELSALPAMLLSQARTRLEELARELGPTARKLQRVATAPSPEIPAEIPPAAPQPVTPPHPEPVLTAVSSTPATHSSSASGSSSAGEMAVAAAKSQLGTPYVWGGTTPGSGFDCSGLTQWAWRQAGVELPRLAQEQTIGTPVAYQDLQAGDLLVWDGHVAMYDGHGSIVEAGDPVSVNPIRTTNMGMAFKGYYRPTG
ncbi:C40 family peptidase [Staphylococcus chromogenes]|nr:C40 family peptidase [Staphylococcus chromogenes]